MVFVGIDLATGETLATVAGDLRETAGLNRPEEGDHRDHSPSAGAVLQRAQTAAALTNRRCRPPLDVDSERSDPNLMVPAGVDLLS